MKPTSSSPSAPEASGGRLSCLIMNVPEVLLRNVLGTTLVPALVVIIDRSRGKGVKTTA